jgi:hypothetical protein
MMLTVKLPLLMKIAEVPKQICMTRDNVSLQLTSVIYYQIVSPHKAAFGISNIRQALIERTQPTLRHVVGARVLQDVIERREEIAQSIGEIIDEVASGWGVRVESMLIKDLVFSQELQDSLSMAAQSKRIGESKVIAARAEVESAKLMRQAADILSSAPAMQIRALEAYQAMAKTSNAKVCRGNTSFFLITNIFRLFSCLHLPKQCKLHSLKPIMVKAPAVNIFQMKTVRTTLSRLQSMPRWLKIFRMMRRRIYFLNWFKFYHSLMT